MKTDVCAKKKERQRQRQSEKDTSYLKIQIPKHMQKESRSGKCSLPN